MTLSVETRARRNGARSARASWDLRTYLTDLFRAPFQVDPEAVVAYTPAERDGLRRAALLRLVVTCLTTILALWLPLVISDHAPVHVIGPQVLAILLGILCLMLNRFGRTFVAALLYVYGVIALIVVAATTGSSGVTMRSILIYGLLSAFIWLAGLMLPPRTIWPTAGLAAAISLLTIITMPLSPALAQDGVPGENVRSVIIGLLATSYVFAATLSWVSARSASAGMESILRAFEREQEMIALKDQFILTANHELRTPIAALYSNVELLAVRGEQATWDQRRRIVERALRAGDAVLVLLDTVLDAGSIEQQVTHLTIQPVDLATFVRDLLQTFDVREFGGSQAAAEPAQARSLRLDIPADAFVLADELRLRQVLVNLLSNALKYSPPGSPIAITAQTLRLTGRRGVEARGSLPEEVRVSVRDAGLGIPPGEAQKLFQRFVRLERDIGGPIRGTGVGLYLCRVLIHAMGGRIWVESSGVPGEGSSFSFTLPRATDPAGAPPDEGAGR
jgi:signal transduction histidine kinase